MHRTKFPFRLRELRNALRHGVCLVALPIWILASPSTSLWAHQTPPVLTSITPNPLPVGTINVTITGTGFNSNSMVYQSYGNNSMIQYSPSSMSSTSITVTGIYQGKATSASFEVCNTSSACSAPITVPVGSAGSGGGTTSSGISGTSGSGTTAPVITAVSPNPLSVGTFSLTIAGTGFQTGSMVYQSYGSNSMIQYSPSSVSPTSITVTGIYQGPATSASFEVSVPGQIYSNAITVPVTASSGGGSGSTSPVYSLTVVNGTIAGGGTSGSFAPGTSVSISARTPLVGEAFQSWTGAQVGNVIAASTTLTMPSANTTVTANFYTPTPIPVPGRDPSAPLDHAAGLAATARLGHTRQPCVPEPGRRCECGGRATTTWPFLRARTKAHQSDTRQSVSRFRRHAGLYRDAERRECRDPGIQLADRSQHREPHQYAQEARNLLMYAMNQAALGQRPARRSAIPSFAIYNRASFTGPRVAADRGLDLQCDRRQRQSDPDRADKATIRSVFMMWANDCLTAETTGGDNPGTPGRR